MTLLEQYEEFSKLSDKKIVFFGAGSLVVRIFSQMPICTENVSYFVDNDSSRWGNNFFLKTIYPPSKLQEDNDNIVVVIANSFIDEISLQLQEMNIKHVYPYSIFFLANHDYSHKQPQKQGRPILTVICPTYNHERWIANALEGFVKQETEYNYEVIVADDASTDHTTDIIMAYAKKYPNIIKSIIRPVNLGASENYGDAISNIKSKYWIRCEGDDYWCNNSFIQKGVTMLENNPDCMMLGAKHIQYDHIKGTTKLNSLAGFPSKFTFPEHYAAFHTTTTMMRTMNYMPFRDTISRLFMFSLGPCCFLNDVVSVYNYTYTGIYSSTSQSWKIKDALSVAYTVNILFDYKYDDWSTKLAAPRAKSLIYFKKIFGKKLGWWIFAKLNRLKYDVQWFNTGVTEQES